MNMKLICCLRWVIVAYAAAATAHGAQVPAPGRSGDQLLAEYFKAEVARIAERSLAGIHSLEDWTSRREQYRQQLAEMLGLWPMPPRTELKATITGRAEHEQFVVEKLHFQSMPGLYVTGNLYLPKGLSQPAPAILYVCGHGNIRKDGISYGAKVSYQHHPGWFARNGYVCLVIDTLQLGEIEGVHHGTYRQNMWWWHSRGYTPAGVEAWNGIRALDYLQSRREVDGQRIGMTGRSGGGAYTWWVAALDERVKVAVPVAGITDLQNHVVDGCVEGHCDCMFMVNMYRWDYAQVAAMLAPRPLLIANTDKDSIFPLDGVLRVHESVRRIYRLYGATDRLGLLITEGPHKDTQELQVPVFRWFGRFLQNQDRPVEMLASPLLQPEQLRVFRDLPTDQVNTRVQDGFVAQAANLPVPDSLRAWESQAAQWLSDLRTRVFGGWPDAIPSLELKLLGSSTPDGIRLARYEFLSQPHVPLRLFLAMAADGAAPRRVVLRIADDADYGALSAAFEHAREAPATLPAEQPSSWRRQIEEQGVALAWVALRGTGPTAWTGDERRRTHVLRRFYLIGQTLDGMRVWDLRCAIAALRTLGSLRDVPIHLEGRGISGVLALYASLFEPVAGVQLFDPPSSHREGPQLLGILRYLDIPQAAALAARSTQIRLQVRRTADWTWLIRTAQSLPELGARLQVETYAGP